MVFLANTSLVFLFIMIELIEAKCTFIVIDPKILKLRLMPRSYCIFSDHSITIKKHNYFTNKNLDLMNLIQSKFE
jgi:hypothetical protein